MDIQDITKEIHRLRFEESMTLEAITNKFGKSIYWVNSRLNKKYEPKRIRQTADDVGTFEDEYIEDKTLSDEFDQIKALRKQGQNYEEIASHFNRSVYWVHSRLKGKYRPKGHISEKLFQEERVVPYMIVMGYTGILYSMVVRKKVALNKRQT